MGFRRSSIVYGVICDIRVIHIAVDYDGYFFLSLFYGCYQCFQVYTVNFLDGAARVNLKMEYMNTRNTLSNFLLFVG